MINLPKVNFGGVAKFVTQKFGRTGLHLSKWSPEILTTVGVVGVVATAVLASKATLGLEDVLDEASADIRSVELSLPPGTEKNAAKTVIYGKLVGRVAKLYAPAVIVGTASIGCLVGSNRILRARNMALAAAYQTVESAFERYRNRVIEEFGLEKDEDYRLGMRDGTREVTDEKGKTKTERIKVIENPHDHAPYARFFDETNPNWSKTPEYSLLWLKGQQNMLNDKLRANGHVFLNEVYEALGFEHTRAGAVVGWLEDGEGDGYIDFGLFDGTDPTKRLFVNGKEYYILLDFNVDGLIHELI